MTGKRPSGEKVELDFTMVAKGVMGAFGVIVVSVLGYIALQAVEVRDTVRELVVEQRHTNDDNAKQDSRLDNHETRIHTLETR